MSSYPILLTCERVVLHQPRASRQDFTLLDEAGAVIGRVVNTDSAGQRFLRGPRQFVLVTGDGVTLAHINDVVEWGADRYEVTGPDGAPLAMVTRRLSWFTKRLSIEPVDGQGMLLRGDFGSKDFQITNEATHGVEATASLTWEGLGDWFLGRDQYVLSFAPGLPPMRRLAVLGSVVALDLIRRKQGNAAAAANSN